MSTIDEDKILNRLKALSQAGPAQEATDRAVQKVREALETECRVGSAHQSLCGGQSPPYSERTSKAR